MFTLFDIVLYTSPIVIFTYFGGSQIVSTTAISKYRKFRLLNTFVSRRHKNIFMILWISINLILQSLFYTFCQLINKTVVKHGDSYEVTYFIQGNKYKMRIPYKDVSPSSVFIIMGDNDIDLTEDIEPFFGPYGDFHGKVTTPSMFNQSVLTIETIDGVSRSFKRDDQIIV